MTYHMKGGCQMAYRGGADWVLAADDFAKSSFVRCKVCEAKRIRNAECARITALIAHGAVAGLTKKEES